MLFADRRPPGTMCEGGVCGSSLEVPVHSLPPAGGVATSTPSFRDRGHYLSSTLGDPFSGDMKCASGDPNCTDSEIRLGMGHGYFEFWSDRIPLYDVSLTVNGGSPVTNSLTFTLGVRFRDDLSGFAEATITQRGGSTQQLDVDAENFFQWTLGDPTIPDGDYFFDFYFRDRAGNVTVAPATASVTLDRVPPSFGSVLIDNGNLVTPDPVVSLDLQATDDRTGISFVRVANSTSSTGTVYPFIPPRTNIDWRLDDSTSGVKTVYAWYRDGAGNWSVQPSTDTIILLDQLSPNARFTFVPDGENIVEFSPGEFQTKILNVPVRFDWNASLIGVLRSIRLSGGPNTTTFDAPLSTNTFTQSYTIASESAGDGPITLTAVFIDVQGREIATYQKSILLYRNPPPNPTLENLQLFSSSLTFTAQIRSTERNIIYYTIAPDPSSILLGASTATINVAYATAPVTFVDLDLRPNSRFFYTVRAFDQLGGSIPGLSVGPVVTLAEPPIRTVDPQGVEISVIRVGWGTGNNPAETEYQVEWSRDPAFPSGQTSQTPWSFRTPVDVIGLQVATAYYFRVRARNSENVVTAWVNLGQGVTLSYIQPQPPLSFFAERVASNSVLWKWIRNPSTESGFQIINSTQGLVADIPLTVSTNAYTYEERGLTPNTVVSRSIFSYNYLNNQFTASASIGATVVMPPAPPSAEPLTARGSEITAHWGPNGNPAGTEYQYQAEIALNAAFTDRREASDWTREFQFNFRGLQPQTTYYARVRSRGQSFQGSQAVSEYVQLGSIRTQTFSAGGEVDIDGSAWQLHLPPNAMDQDFTLQMELNPTNFTTTDLGVIQRATEKAYRESNGYRFPIPGGIVEIALTDVNGNPIHPTLKKQGQLVHLYGVSNGQSINSIQAQGGPSLQIPDPLNPQSNRTILANTLRIFVLDTRTETWFRLPTNDVDVFLSQVEGGVQRFGVFAAMGAPSTDVNEVVAFPVPWRPNGPNAGLGSGQTGTEAGGITFGNIPQEGSIKIIDLQGALVREINLNGSPLETWDAQNANGEKVASGTYYWIAESAGNRKTGKLMVIR